MSLCIGKNNAAGFVKIKVLVSGQAKIAGPATGFEFISMENWGNSLKRYIILGKTSQATGCVVVFVLQSRRCLAVG